MLVINLLKRQDRWDRLKSQFIPDHQSILKRVPAIDGEYLSGNAFLTGRQCSCCLSHRSAIIESTRGKFPELIVEDDLEFHYSYSKCLETISKFLKWTETNSIDWDIFSIGYKYAGGVTTERIKDETSGLIFKKYLTGEIWGAHAYIVNPRESTLNLVLNRLNEMNITTDDLFYSKEFTTYLSETSMIGQYADYSNLENRFVEEK